MEAEDILKRLAEILGWEWDDKLQRWFAWDEGDGCLIAGATAETIYWNALGPLIEKHSLTIQRGWVKPGEWGAVAQGCTGGEWSSHESLAMAVCLAVIEAHK